MTDTKKFGYAAFLVILLFAVFFLVKTVILPWVYGDDDDTAANGSKGGGGGYLSANLSVNNTPGIDPAAITDGNVQFPTSHLVGYACARCSDSGAQDTKTEALDAHVVYQCPNGAALGWQRSQKWDTAFETLGKAPGNYIASDPARPVDPLEYCKKMCQNPPSSDFGACKATTYDAVSRSCHYFFSCDKVEKKEGNSTFIVDFDVAAQPTVINTNA